MHTHVSNILATAGQPNSHIRPTVLFNEGWMLRLLLDHLSTQGASSHPFSFTPGAVWFSEALLPSAFLARSRGDKLAEGWTNADGVVGHFQIGSSAKGDLSLNNDAQQLTVIEAKMFSGLSKRVKNCPLYNQAARYVACIAEVLCRANRDPKNVNPLAFYVVAPESQINAGVFGNLVTEKSIAATVAYRVGAYMGDRYIWHFDWFLPTLQHIVVELVSWESVLDGQPVYLHEFYKNCLLYNDPRSIP